MTRKRIPRKYTDLIHMAIFLIVLIWFANYESEKKTDIATASTLDPDMTYHSELPLNTSVTTWK